MKNSKKSKIAAIGLLSAAAVALLAPSAHAQTVSYTQGDLLLGFELPGNSNDYVVDLGPASYFIGLSATAGTTNVTSTLSLGNIAADLSSTFGSGWASNSLSSGSNVQWGIFGATSKAGSAIFGLPNNTLFLTQAESIPGTQSAAPGTSVNALQKTYNTQLIDFANAFNGLSDTANSSVAAVESTGAANSWSSANPSYSAFTTGLGIEQPASGSNIGPTNSVLDFYELQPASNGSGTFLGSFSLSSSGNLDFTSAASVPEPSTFGLVGVSSIGLFFLLRRRRGMNIA